MHGGQMMFIIISSIFINACAIRLINPKSFYPLIVWFMKLQEKTFDKTSPEMGKEQFYFQEYRILYLSL